MTPEHRQLVSESWARLSPDADSLARHFYARLFEIDPGAARLFAATDMTAQRKKFTDMIAAIIRAIDEPDELVPNTAALARRHVGYGVEDRHYDSVGEALVWAVGETLSADAFSAEARAAWVEAYALIASVMRRAAGRASGALPKVS